MKQHEFPILFRPHPVGHLFWWFFGPAIWLALYIGFSFIGAPFEVMCFIYALGISVLISAAHVSTSYCRISDDGIETGLVFGGSMKWNEIEKWSRLGDNGSLFILSNQGKMIGTGGWAFYGDRVDRLEEILLERVGNPSTGEDTVMPKWLGAIIGEMTKNAR